MSLTMLTTKAIRKFIKDLENSDESRRRTAAQELADGDERAVYPLIRALHDSNAGVQDAAMRSLIAIGGEVTAYMVIPLLRGEALQRNTAIIILQSLGRVSVPLLYRLLKDKDDDVRKFALDIMGEIRDDVIPERLLPLLEDPNANVRASAAKTIGALQYTAAVPELASALGNDEEWVLFTILETLGVLRASESVPAIARLLESDSLAIRFAAIETLGVIGAEAAIEPLLQCIQKSGDDDEKGAAVRSLVQIGLGPEMKELSGILTWMVKEGDWEEKLIALKGLVDIRDCSATGTIIDISGALDPSMPEDEERLDIVINSLRSLSCEKEILAVLDDSRIKFRGRMIAASLLGDLCSEKAIPSLIAHMKSDKRDVRRACAEAISKIAVPEIANSLMQFLHDSDGHFRKSVIVALGKVSYSPAFDELFSMMSVRDEYTDILEEEVKALLRMNPGAMRSKVEGLSVLVREMCGRYSEDIEMLLALSHDEEQGVRISAITGLGRFGDTRAVERLYEALGDSAPEIRRAAVMALGAGERSLDRIRGMLCDSDMWVRTYAVKAVGDTMDPAAVEILAPMLGDAEVPVVLAAIEALARIGGDEAMRAISEHGLHAQGQVLEAIERALEYA